MNKLKKNLNRALSIDLILKNRLKPPSRTALIVRNDGIGDFLLFSGFIPLYKNYFEKIDVKTVFLVKKQYAELASLYLPKNSILYIDDELYYSSLSYRRQFLARLMEISPKYIVSSIYRSSQGDDIVRMLSAKDRTAIGYEGETSIKNKKSYFYDIVIKSYDKVYRSSYERYNHVICHEQFFFSGLMDRLGLLKRFKVPSLYECRPYLNVNENNAFKDYIGNYFSYIVGAGDTKRVYPIGKVSKILMSVFKNTNLNCVILGGKKEKKLSIAISEKISSEYKKRLKDYVGKISLTESLSILKGGKFTIGNETGMTHASWIMKTPTIVIYGGGHFGRFLPLTKEGFAIYKKMPCYCCDWSCKFGERPVKCISDIKEHYIYRKIQEIINTA